MARARSLALARSLGLSLCRPHRRLLSLRPQPRSQPRKELLELERPRPGTPTALRPFLVERYPGWTDGSASLSSSETEPLTMNELLAHADDEGTERWRTLSLGYPSHNEGSPWLRREIAASYSGGIDERLINVCVPQEGIYLTARALLSPGDHVVTTVPHYQSLSEVARSIGCEVSAWRPEGSPARFEVSTLHSLLRPSRTKLVIANWPHNPTGALPTPEELLAVVAAVEASGAHLMIDEMYANDLPEDTNMMTSLMASLMTSLMASLIRYRGLEHSGSTQLAAAVEAYSRGVSLSGLSKTVGLPGLRIGWLASRDAAFMVRD